MSFINSLIEKLNTLQNDEELNKIEPEQLKHILKTAADTIWELSEKLAAANMERSIRFYNDGWILCSDRLPTKEECDKCKIFRVTVKLTNPESFVTMTMEYSYDYQQWRYHGSKTYYNVIAWKPLEEPYREETS